jgi:hypothetical protein
MDRKSIVNAVKELNKLHLAESIDVKSKEGDLIENFMLTIESIMDEGKQSDIPENLAIIYNELAEEEDKENAEPVVKKEEKKKEVVKKEVVEKEPVVKREERGDNPWKDGSSCSKFFQIIVNAGKTGVSIEEGLKIADKEEIPAKDRLSRIKDVWYTAVKRGFAEKKDGKYFSNK